MSMLEDELRVEDWDRRLALLDLRRRLVEEREDLLRRRPGCSCSKTGCCAYHAETWNALTTAINALDIGVERLGKPPHCQLCGDIVKPGSFRESKSGLLVCFHCFQTVG